jgi:hypothetical protein
MGLEETLNRCESLGKSLAPDVEKLVSKAVEADRDAFEAVVSRLAWRSWSRQKMEAFLSGLQSELEDKEAKGLTDLLRRFFLLAK